MRRRWSSAHRNSRSDVSAEPGEKFLHGLIERIPETHRYRLTAFGFRVAVFCTRAYSRILRPGLGLVLPAISSLPCPLRRSFDKLDQEVKFWVERAKLAA